jgi:hypothetical protein
MSSGSASISVSAVSASIFSGTISPDFTRGEARLNHCAGGRTPKNASRRSRVHGSVSRLRAITSCPALTSHSFCRLLLAQPGFS